jgi:hypothetical protein
LFYVHRFHSDSILQGGNRQCKRKNITFWHDFLLQKMLASVAKIAQYRFQRQGKSPEPPGRHRPPAGLDGKNRQGQFAHLADLSGFKDRRMALDETQVGLRLTDETQGGIMGKGFTYDYNGNGFETWESPEKAKSMANSYMSEAMGILGARIKSEVILWGEIKGGLEVDEDGNATMTE